MKPKRKKPSRAVRGEGAAPNVTFDMKAEFALSCLPAPFVKSIIGRLRRLPRQGVTKLPGYGETTFIVVLPRGLRAIFRREGYGVRVLDVFPVERLKLFRR